MNVVWCELEGSAIPCWEMPRAQGGLMNLLEPGMPKYAYCKCTQDHGKLCSHSLFVEEIPIHCVVRTMAEQGSTRSNQWLLSNPDGTPLKSWSQRGSCANCCCMGFPELPLQEKVPTTTRPLLSCTEARLEIPVVTGSCTFFFFYT